MEKGPDEFIENALVGGCGKQRLRLVADFAAAPNQSRDVGVDAGRTEEVQNRFRRGLGWRAGDRGSHCGNECEGFRKTLRCSLSVMAGSLARVRPASDRPSVLQGVSAQ